MKLLGTLSSVALLISCSGGSGDPAGDTAAGGDQDVIAGDGAGTFSIGGALAGVAGTVVLQNNGGDDLSLNTDGAFAFAMELSTGETYNVTVLTHPLNQLCTVSNGTGTVSGTDVTNVTVSCMNTVQTFAIGGIASGLLGPVTLQNNGADDLIVTGPGQFQFNAQLADAATYAVSIFNQPPSQTCRIERGTGTVASLDVTDVALICGVGAHYPLTGAAWNDYVTHDGADRFDAGDVACDPTAHDGAGYDACIHGGEMRALVLDGYATCTNITVQDSLGLFDWVCRPGTDPDTDPARAVSTGLKPTSALSDLIDCTAACAWRPNIVQASFLGTPLTTPGPEVWWPNPIVETTAGGTFSDSGTIYVLTGNGSGVGVVIDADRVGFIMAPGITLQGPPTGAAIRSNGDSFLWLEGDIENAASDAVVWGTVRFSVMRDIEARDGQAGGFYVGNRGNNHLSNLRAIDNLEEGLTIEVSDANTVRDLTVNVDPGAVPFSGTGLRFSMADNNDVEGVTISGGSIGIDFVGGSSDNRLHLLSISNVLGYGMLLDGSFASATNNHISLASITNNEVGGIALFAAIDNTFLDLEVANNNDTMGLFGSEIGIEIAEDPFSMVPSYGNTFDNVFVTNQSGRGIIATNSDNTTLSNILATNGGGVWLRNSADSRLVSITATNINGDAIRIDDSPASVLINATATNSTYGVWIIDSDDVTAANILTVNCQAIGFSVITSDDVRATNITSAHNGTGIELADSSNGQVHGNLQVGGNGEDCVVNGGTNRAIDDDNAPGTDDMVHDGICLEDGGSTFGAAIPFAIAGSLVGKATSDSTNTDGSASLAYDGISDWLGFDNFYRGWGIEGGAFPDATNRGSCESGDTCHIWDWSLTTGGVTSLRNTLTPNGDQSFDHTFSFGATTFMWSAVEFMGDGVGDDDALCEIGEVCAETPLTGGYQGHGGYTASGSTTGGSAVPNVNLFAPQSLGY